MLVTRSHSCLNSTRSDQRAFTLVELLVVIAIIGILVALLLPAVQAAREAARRASCQSSIKNVALAVLNYESTRQVLPDGMNIPDSALANISYGKHDYGKNWVIEILPYLEAGPIYDSFDFSVKINDTSSGNPNREARGSKIPVLLCPSDEFNDVLYQGARGSAHGDNWGRTNYAANSGRADIWPRRNAGPDSRGWKDDCKRGVMGVNTAVKLRRITDGLTSTIMIGEIRAGLTEKDARGVWALGHAGASLLAGYGAGGDDNGPNACAPTTGRPDDVFADICDEDFAREICMSCDVPGNYFAQATVRSAHVGGAFVALCDGSVQFITDDIETSGDNGACCSPWDYMIASADSETRGTYNGATGRRGACQ